MNAPFPTPMPITSALFHRLARSGALGSRRIELRRGMLVEMAPQFMPHLRVKRLIAKALEHALETAGLPWIVDQEGTVAFGNGFDPMPDIVVWDPALLTDSEGPIPAVAVKLIVEVSSTTLADDLGEKYEDYAAAGLAEYWVADVKGRLILRHCEPKGADYVRREPVLFGQPASWLTQELEVETASLA